MQNVRRKHAYVCKLECFTTLRFPFIQRNSPANQRPNIESTQRHQHRTIEYSYLWRLAYARVEYHLTKKRSNRWQQL